MFATSLLVSLLTLSQLSASCVASHRAGAERQDPGEPTPVPGGPTPAPGDPVDPPALEEPPLEPDPGMPTPDPAAPCCFAHPRYAGSCVVTPTRGETCASILAYLNDQQSVGKTYCGSTDLRGGWRPIQCT